MSCAPSGATPTASTTLSGGERSCPLPVRGDPSWRESPMESRRGEKSGQRTILGPARMGFSNRRTPSRRTLSRTPRSRAIGLEGVQMKPRPRLYHRIQPQRRWMPASTECLLLYCHEGKNPILICFAPKAHFRNFLWWGRSMHLLDRSWPPVLGSGVRHVLEESFLNFSRVTERFS